MTDQHPEPTDPVRITLEGDAGADDSGVGELEEIEALDQVGEVDQIEALDTTEEAEAEEPEAEPAPPRPPAQYFDVTTQYDEALAAAVAAIRAGESIVLPTDTVYGIGANALSATAVQGLLDAKQRGRDMPPPVLIADAASLGSLVQFVDEDARALADRFWPGALTLVLRMQEGLRIDLGETRGTIAVRVPDHEFTRALLRRTGPLAVSSANVSGQPASTDIAGAREQLGDAVAVYLDAGPTPGSMPSTIVDFTVSTLGSLLRPGAISLDELHEVAKFVQDEREPEPEPEPTSEADDEPAEETRETPPDA
ncbi:L-threonylcarbamoyladenylate synthase [Propionibacteriaceae bacterium Y1923]|uniref:L-threonylcarbamoyladenylate synthase n=1 Tax=Aestuariimicrobium sp. Y1814 TaxID=3418742 RepID=UPI003C218CDB